MKELDFFKEIWRERSHYSEVSGEYLGVFSPVYFSHLLTKGSHPELRLDKENILLMTFEEHRLWENYQHKIKDIPMWDKVFKQRDKLKYKYGKE